MQRQSLDEERANELRTMAREMFPFVDGPPLPGTIVKLDDDLQMFGVAGDPNSGLPARVLTNHSTPGMFVGYTDPQIITVDGIIEWPYAPEYIIDRAPLDPQEPPMPVYVEPPPEGGQPQQAGEDATERQMGGTPAPKRTKSVREMQQDLWFVLRQLPREAQKKVRDRLRVSRPELFSPADDRR
jgi:hypothetical protein